jgi:hypothetical protein
MGGDGLLEYISGSRGLRGVVTWYLTRYQEPVSTPNSTQADWYSFRYVGEAEYNVDSGSPEMGISLANAWG